MSDLILEKIGLAMSPGIGPVTAKQLVAYCGGLEGVWSANKKELLLIPGIGEVQAKQILSKTGLSLAEPQVRKLEKEGAQCLFFLDPEYPWRLKDIPDAPVALFAKGHFNLNKEKHLGVIGTRQPSQSGKMLTEEFVAFFQAFDINIVSGLAYGIDITAHKKCIECDIATIAVTGTSLDIVYPDNHSKYAKQLLKNGGILSEFPFTTGPDYHNFPMRNRIIAGLCDAILVVESAEQGGSMITANLASQYNRDIFAIPGKPSDKYSRGCNQLIKTNRAALVENPQDLCDAMNWTEKPTIVFQQSLFEEMTEEELKILQLLNRDLPVSIDKIYNESGLTPSGIASLLLQLEFKGAILACPGKRYLLA
jgi:DNA processing protein